MRGFRVFLIILAACAVSFAVVVVAAVLSSNAESNQTQADLDPFYTPPDPVVGKPGDIIRSEPMTGFNISNGSGYRVLYVSQAPNGELRASGAMVFVPESAQAKDRPVLAFAHGTSGFGDACAPSRDPATPVNEPFIQTVMDLGYVYTATDYVGLGTPGDPYYLIGKSEANDVVNSVRAARNFPGSGSGTRYAVMGHSQGGHSAIWTGHLSEQIAPELELVGVATSAPAAQLGALLDEQWNTAIGWAIGPEVMLTWPTVYPNLNADALLTANGQTKYKDVAYECIETAAIEGLAEENLFHSQLFAKSPKDSAPWYEAIVEQTPPPLPPSMPMIMNQSMYDGIVLPNTNALTQQEWCAAGSNLQTNWLGQLATGPLAGLQTHGNTLLAGWPMLTDWIQARFGGKPATPNCGFTPPIKPYSAGES